MPAPQLAFPLYMLRHGETAWNTERRMQGTKNSDLTEHGRRQALAMGRALKAELARESGPTIFLRSPLGRTRETADIIGQVLGLDPGHWRDDPRLADMPGAQALVFVTAEHIFPNCPRYIHDLAGGTASPYTPAADTPPVEPGWKSSDDFKDVVPPRKV